MGNLPLPGVIGGKAHMGRARQCVKVGSLNTFDCLFVYQALHLGIYSPQAWYAVPTLPSLSLELDHIAR